MTSYRITAQAPDCAVQEVKVEAPNLASAFRAASAWARVDEEPATTILVGPIEDGQWTWVCSHCQAEGPPQSSEGAAHRDADNFHRHCQES
jgi:hypothetical protein